MSPGMQTFLPYADFRDSSAVLDDRRLGKQRVETFQILRALTWPTYAWKNHPAVRMWRGFVPALVTYGLAMCQEWSRRGYQDTVSDSLLEFTGGRRPDLDELVEEGQLPPWLGLDVLHLSHQSSLVRKDPAWYRPLFPDVPDDLPYYWPPDLFPRWPVRSGPDGLDLAAAVKLLGLDDVRPGQADAVGTVRAGRDCVLELPVGAGASTTGLLAGLVVPGRTLWVVTDDGQSRGAFDSAAELPEVELRAPARRAAARAAQTARQPGRAELSAMADEQLPSEWVFVRVPDLPVRVRRMGSHAPGLVVVDHAHALPTAEAAAIAEAREALGSPPVLALSQPLDVRGHRRLVERLRLRGPIRVEG